MIDWAQIAVSVERRRVGKLDRRLPPNCVDDGYPYYWGTVQYLWDGYYADIGRRAAERVAYLGHSLREVAVAEMIRRMK